MGAPDIAASARLPAPVLVLGGAGFIGRHVVDAIVARGRDVIVGTRHPRRRSNDAPGLHCREVHLDRLLDPAAMTEPGLGGTPSGG